MIEVIKQFVGCEFPLLELTPPQREYAKKIAMSKSNPYDRRSPTQRAYDAYDGVRGEVSSAHFLASNGINVEEPKDWWHDYIIAGTYWDHKCRLNGNSFTQSEREHYFCAQNKDIEIFYLCSDLIEKPGFGVIKGVISSKSKDWRAGKNDGSRYVFCDYFKYQ